MIHRLGPSEPTVAPPPSDRLPLGAACGSMMPDSFGVPRNRITQDRIELMAAMIMKLSLAFGFASLILAVFFALIYSFLRWVLA